MRDKWRFDEIVGEGRKEIRSGVDNNGYVSNCQSISGSGLDYYLYIHIHIIYIYVQTFPVV
jgi:hypothetical protein